MKPVLVDTSVWVHYLRKGDGATGDKLGELLEHDNIFITGVVIAELFSGARNKKDKKSLANLIEPLPYLETTRLIWRKAGEYRNSLLKQGHSVPLPDTIIAATAIHYNSELFSLDSHFSTLAESIPLKLFEQ